MSSAPTPLPLPPLSFLQRWRSNLIQAPLVFLATGAFGTVSLVASLFEKDGRLQHRIARRWAKTLLKISGAPVTVSGRENLGRAPVAVYACNHLSFMDTPVVFGMLPFQFRILARHDLWKLPFIGGHLQRSGQIPVNADNPKASISSLSVGVRALKAGMPLFVFPEGGRAIDGHLSTFMSGPAYMAIRAQVPIVPMAIVGTYELLPMHGKHYRPHPLRLAVGEPIPTAGLTTKFTAELTERLREAIYTLYYTYVDAPQFTATSEPVEELT